MPLFFFVSGMFFKCYGSFRLFAIKKINTLLIPFLFFFIITSVCLPNFAHYVVGIPMERTAEGLGWKSLYAFLWPEHYFNNPIWFVWCLFVINFFFYILLKLSILFRLQTPVLTFLCFSFGCLGVYLGRQNINLGGNVDTAMSAIPFFLMGYLTNNHFCILKKAKRNVHFVVVEILVLLSLTYVCSMFGNVNYLSNSFSLPFPLVYIGGLCGTYAVILLSKVFKTLPLITYFGRYSLIILVTHQPMIGLYRYLCHKFFIEGTNAVLFSMCIMMVSYLLIIPILSKVIPQFVGQDNLLKND